MGAEGKSDSAEILLIDDEVPIGRLLGVFLSRKGLRLTAVTTGEEGLALLEQRPFDLVLLDIHLPGMNGPEILRRMNQGWNRPPVILITGGGSQSPEAKEALDLGAVALFEKPFQLPLLLAEIRRVLRLPPE